MKVLVVLLGLSTATFLSGVADIVVTVRAYNATGELDIPSEPLTLGTRVLLTCDVRGHPKGHEALSYRWYHNCMGLPNSACELHNPVPYYKVVKDTLLVDVISQDQGVVYYCRVSYLQRERHGTTQGLSVAGNAAPFLYTPTSLLPEHSVLTDVQQATGRNGQQWITCRSGGQETRIWMGTVTLPTPTVSGRNDLMWTLTSPNGSQVERYIVEFECRVRNITFVEKAMSVSASGGTGRVATSVFCFGGLGQLYRVKVWAVSGPNISRALACTPNGQCSEEDNASTASGGPPTMSTLMPGNADKTLTPNETQDPNRGIYIPSVAVPVSAGALMFIVGIATFIAGVVMLVRAKRALHHSSQTPLTGTDHYEMVDEAGKRAPLGAGVYNKVHRLDIQTDGHTKHYQELDLAKMERREYASIKV